MSRPRSRRSAPTAASAATSRSTCRTTRSSRSARPTTTTSPAGTSASRAASATGTCRTAGRSDGRARLARRARAGARSGGVRRRAGLHRLRRLRSLGAGAVPAAQGGVLARTARDVGRLFPDRRVARDLEPHCVRRRDRDRAGSDPRGRRVPGEPRPASLGRVRRRPARTRRGARSAAAARVDSAAGRPLDDRLGLAGDPAAEARPDRPHLSDQGHASRGRSDPVGEGHRGARDDRRPRAQRPLPRLRSRQRPLAGAARRAPARRRHAPRRHGRGRAETARDADRAARGRVARRIRHGLSEEQCARADRRAGAGRAGGLDGGARSDLRERRSRPRAHDPHLCRGRPRDSPLGGRGHRLGLGARRRDRGVLGEGEATARPRVMDVCAVAVAGRGLVEPGGPVFAADDDALLRGRSVFETARVYAGRPFLLDRHLARFALSAERLRLPPPDAAECERLAELVIGASDKSDLALRLYWTGRTLAATAAPIDPELEALRSRGLRLATVPWSTGALASAKSMSYAENMAAQDTAIVGGADDALLVGDDGTVLEAPTANVWWREGDT